MKKLLTLALGLLMSTLSVAQEPYPFMTTTIAELDQPWALEFLPDGRLLVTELPGNLQLVTQDGNMTEITGIPDVVYENQGGLGDVVLHPQFASNNLVYISYAEAGPDNTAGAAVARAVLNLEENTLENLEVIWRQVPKVTGRGHYSHRILFGPEGDLWISSGDRQLFDPAQDMEANLGKILHLNDDGTPATDNPFAGMGPVTSEIWTLGHRNPLGIAFDPQNRLWNVEMGPLGGDELNLVERGNNYGYPIVSNGNHYDGQVIPDHDTRPEFVKPKVWWNPVISPSSLMFYTGNRFPDWQGNALISGLSSMSIIRVEIEGDTAVESVRYLMGKRIRGLKQGPDGYIWAIEDGRPERTTGRLMKLTPRM